MCRACVVVRGRGAALDIFKWGIPGRFRVNGVIPQGCLGNDQFIGHPCSFNPFCPPIFRDFPPSSSGATGSPLVYIGR